MNKLSAATTRNWSIKGIEFTTVETAPDGSLLVEGIVENPAYNDVWYIGARSFVDSALSQLVDEGFLEIFWPHWCDKETGCLCLRLKLDGDGKFEDGSEPSDCIICKRAFSFRDNGDNMVKTAPASGPSWSCGGSPAEYDSACTECIEADPQEEEPEYDGCYDDERGL